MSDRYDDPSRRVNATTTRYAAPDERQAGLREPVDPPEPPRGWTDEERGYLRGRKAGWRAALAVAQVPAQERPKCPACGWTHQRSGDTCPKSIYRVKGETDG